MTHGLLKVTGAGAALALLAACNGGPIPAEDLRASNPIAVFCIEQGGDYLIEPQIDGSASSTCVLADGTRVDAGDYFRENAPRAES